MCREMVNKATVSFAAFFVASDAVGIDAKDEPKRPTKEANFVKETNYTVGYGQAWNVTHPI